MERVGPRFLSMLGGGMEAGWAGVGAGGLSDWSSKMPKRFFCGVVAAESFD